jgi:hypothetical protein
VIEHHGGSAEKGKDIIGYYEGLLGEHRYVCVVAKVGDIHGSVSKRGSASEVLFQAEQALSEPYTDVYTLQEVRMDECWVMTTGEIKNTAIDSIRGTLAKSNLDKLVRFIDGKRLVELVSLYMPGFWYRIEAERDHLRVGDHVVRVLTMKEAITETRPLVLDALLKIPANFYVVTEWTPLPADKARKEVNKRRRHFNMSKTGFVSQMGNDTTKTNPRDVLVDESKQSFLRRYQPLRLPPKQMELSLSA